MRIINIIGVLLGLLLSAVTIVNATEPPKGFRTFKWGVPPSSALKKLSGPTADGVTIYVPASGKTLQPLFEVQVSEEAYSFSNGKFYSGSAWLDGQGNFEKMKAALIKAYGQPSFVNEGLSLWNWKWPGSQIEVHLSYQKKFSRTTVTFVNNSM